MFLTDILLYVVGLIYLQIFFVITHMIAHSIFLEYDAFVPHNKRVPTSPIYYYAFYHHHCEPDNKEDWASTYGEYMSGSSYDGQRAIIAVHWHGYSLLIFPKILLVGFWCYMCPKLFIFFAGYEIGVFLLPFAHMWQHVTPKKFGSFKSILHFLETVGLIADKRSHKMHHVYTHQTVYQDFSSSGLYLRCIDQYLNGIWNDAFMYASNNHMKPRDILIKYARYSYVVLFVLIPFLVYSVSV